MPPVSILLPTILSSERSIFKRTSFTPVNRPVEMPPLQVSFPSAKKWEVQRRNSGGTTEVHQSSFPVRADSPLSDGRSHVNRSAKILPVFPISTLFPVIRRPFPWNSAKRLVSVNCKLLTSVCVETSSDLPIVLQVCPPLRLACRKRLVWFYAAERIFWPLSSGENRLLRAAAAEVSVVLRGWTRIWATNVWENRRKGCPVAEVSGWDNARSG